MRPQRRSPAAGDERRHRRRPTIVLRILLDVRGEAHELRERGIFRSHARRSPVGGARWHARAHQSPRGVGRRRRARQTSRGDSNLLDDFIRQRVRVDGVHLEGLSVETHHQRPVRESLVVGAHLLARSRVEFHARERRGETRENFASRPPSSAGIVRVDDALRRLQPKLLDVPHLQRLLARVHRREVVPERCQLGSEIRVSVREDAKLNPRTSSSARGRARPGVGGGGCDPASRTRASSVALYSMFLMAISTPYPAATSRSAEAPKPDAAVPAAPRAKRRSVRCADPALRRPRDGARGASRRNRGFPSPRRTRRAGVLIPRCGGTRGVRVVERGGARDGRAAEGTSPARASSRMAWSCRRRWRIGPRR